MSLDRVFGRCAPRLLDIGCGNGDTTLALAREHPDGDCIAVEVYRPGAGSLLRRLAAQRLGNVRLICRDIVEVLERQLPEESLDMVLLLFPDPWPKKRHHKRRLINDGFLALLASRLKPRGRIFIATDWRDYLLQILDCLRRSAALANLAGEGRTAPRPRWRPLTRYETAARREGKRIYDLILARRA